MLATALPKHGPTGVGIDSQPSALEAFVRSHTDGSAVPLGIARPKDEQQVEAVVEWANRHNVALVPVSSPAGPRRRGDTAPAVPALVIDLSKMNRMLHADARDAIALIEPGLTFMDFDAKLRSFGLRSHKPLLPRRTKSVMAAFLEREPIITPQEHWDTSDPLAALSITFGSGEAFRTGTAGLPGTLAANLKGGNRQMMAAGPIATDYTRVLLGSQGTLGIVSWASIYCERIPAREESYFYEADDYASLAEFARLLALRQLGMHVFMLDRTQAAAALGLKSAAFDEAAADRNRPRWLLYVSIAAPDFSPDAAMAWQRADLATLAAQTGARQLREDDSLSAIVLADRLQNLPAAYFKDAPRGQHREIFCLSQMDRVGELVTVADRVLGQSEGVRAGVYVQPTIQGSSCHVEFTLYHSVQDTAEAKKLEKQLVEKVASAGGFLSRPYGDWSSVAYSKASNIVPYLQKVKDIFDPKRLMNPKRLCF